MQAANQTASPDIHVSRIEAYLFCPRAWLLDTFTKQDGLPITGFEAKSAWLKHAFKALIPKERYFGIDLKPLERLKGSELAAALAYHSAEAFGSAKKRVWWNIVKEGKYMGRDIVWLYKPGKKFADSVSAACEAYYNHLLEDGIPLSDLGDIDIAFRFGGRKWVVRPGLVRSGGILEEVQTGRITKREVDADWTIAPKLYAIYMLAQNDAYRMKWRANDLRYRRVSLNSGDYYEPDKIVHMHAALAVVEDVERRIANKEFPPDHKKCETCRYNVLRPDGKPACDARNPNYDILKPMEQF